MGEFLPAFGLQVGDDDAGAAIGQLACGGRTDSGCAAGDDCTGSIEIHVLKLHGEPTDPLRVVPPAPRNCVGFLSWRKQHCAAPPGSPASRILNWTSSFSANSARRPTGRIGGECLAVAEQIRRSGAAAWTGAFAALAERQHADAVRHDAAGHALSARERYLHAANSFRAAEYFTLRYRTACGAGPGQPRRVLGRDGQRSRPHRTGVVTLARSTPTRLLVGPTGADEPGPALIVTSGFDGTPRRATARSGLRPATRLAGDADLRAGPDGHRANRVRYPFRSGHRKLGIGLDRPRPRPFPGRPERLALLGISFGGYFAARAAAHDPRISALVANSPVIDLRAYMVSFVAGMGGDPRRCWTRRMTSALTRSTTSRTTRCRIRSGRCRGR